MSSIGIVLGTITVLALVLAGFIALLVYLPLRGEEKRTEFTCPEEQYTVMCVIRSHLVPSPERL